MWSTEVRSIHVNLCSGQPISTRGQPVVNPWSTVVSNQSMSTRGQPGVNPWSTVVRSPRGQHVVNRGQVNSYQPVVNRGQANPWSTQTSTQRSTLTLYVYSCTVLAPGKAFTIGRRPPVPSTSGDIPGPGEYAPVSPKAGPAYTMSTRLMVRTFALPIYPLVDVKFHKPARTVHTLTASTQR
jgi:hypothetical protein